MSDRKSDFKKGRVDCKFLGSFVKKRINENTGCRKNVPLPFLSPSLFISDACSGVALYLTYTISYSVNLHRYLTFSVRRLFGTGIQRLSQRSAEKVNSAS